MHRYISAVPVNRFNLHGADLSIMSFKVALRIASEVSTREK